MFLKGKLGHNSTVTSPQYDCKNSTFYFILLYFHDTAEAPWSVLYHVTIYLYVYRISLVCDIYYAIN